MESLRKRVRDANLKVFERKKFEDYEQNPSIFDASRQQEIDEILRRLGGERLVDIGCGTGNVLRLAKKYFRVCCGMDLSSNFMRELRRREGTLHLGVGEAEWLPYRSESFDAVSMYALLHHLVDYRTALREAHRVLKPGGALYIDHDPNYFFGRFYHIYYRLRYLGRPGFGDNDTEASEWHHTRSGGLNPMRISEYLTGLGFRDVQVRFRITTNPALPRAFKLARTMMRALTRIYPFKSLYTHFCIIARK